MQELPGNLRFIDLDDLGGGSPISQAAAEIRSVGREAAGPGDLLAPCVVVLTSADLHREDTQRIVQAGGFVRRKPDGFTETLRAGDQQGALELLLGGADWTSDWPGQQLPAGDRNPDGSGDLLVYERPPFQLDDRSYDHWIERMRAVPGDLED